MRVLRHAAMAQPRGHFSAGYRFKRRCSEMSPYFLVTAFLIARDMCPDLGRRAVA